MNEEQKEELRHFLYKQSGKSSIYFNQLINCEHIEESIMIFTASDLRELRNLVDKMLKGE